MTSPAVPDLTRLEELAEKATEGPWFVDVLDRIFVGNRADGRTSGLWSIVYAGGDRLVELKPEAQERDLTDAEFIAALRNAAPSLLAAYRAVQAAREIHRPRTTTVYSPAHHRADHEIEDERCGEACFEPWTLCDGCGSAWPCSTAAALGSTEPKDSAE